MKLLGMDDEPEPLCDSGIDGPATGLARVAADAALDGVGSGKQLDWVGNENPVGPLRRGYGQRHSGQSMAQARCCCGLLAVQLRRCSSSGPLPADLRDGIRSRNFCRVRATDTDQVFTDVATRLYGCWRLKCSVGLSPKSRALCPRPSWDRLEQLPSMLSGVLPVGVGCVRVL